MPLTTEFLTAPILDIVNVSGRIVRIRLRDSENPNRRGKRPGVEGATLFTYVGAEPPSTDAGWKFAGNTAKTTVDVHLADTVAPGAKVWLTAFWFNDREQTGPACRPVSTNVQFSGVSLAA